MKILYLAPETGISINMSGGAGTHMRGTVEYLSKKNEVIAAIGGDLQKASVEKENNILEPKSAPFGKSLLKRFIPRELRLTLNDFLLIKANEKVFEQTSKLIDKNGVPDIIYERSAYGFDTGLKISQKYNIPLVLESDVTLLDLIKPRTSIIFNKLFYRWIEEKKIRNAHSIVVMSEPSIELMRRVWEIDHDRIYFKGLGIKLKGKDKRQTKKVDLNLRYDLSGKFVVGYVGIFQDYQNIPILFEAAEILKNYKDIVIVIIGTGARIEEYRKTVKDKGLKNIIFTGLVHNQDIEAFYDRIDLGVITDNASHIYPVKYLEFLSHGIPTLIPNYEAFNFFFKNESSKNKFSFTPKSAIELSDKIINAKENYVGCVQETLYSKNVVITEFTWDRCGERLELALVKTLEQFSSIIRL